MVSWVGLTAGLDAVKQKNCSPFCIPVTTPTELFWLPLFYVTPSNYHSKALVPLILPPCRCSIQGHGTSVRLSIYIPHDYRPSSFMILLHLIQPSLTSMSDNYNSLLYLGSKHTKTRNSSYRLRRTTDGKIRTLLGF